VPKARGSRPVSQSASRYWILPSEYLKLPLLIKSSNSPWGGIKGFCGSHKNVVVNVECPSPRLGSSNVYGQHMFPAPWSCSAFPQWVCNLSGVNYGQEVARRLEPLNQKKGNSMGHYPAIPSLPSIPAPCFVTCVNHMFLLLQHPKYLSAQGNFWPFYVRTRPKNLNNMKEYVKMVF